MLDRLLLRATELRVIGTLGQVFHRLIEGPVLAHFAAIGGEQRQAGLVGLAQLVTVEHPVEVTDRRPEFFEAVVDLLQGQHQGIPVQGLRLLDHPVHLLAAFVEQRFELLGQVGNIDSTEMGEGVEAHRCTLQLLQLLVGVAGL